jgi:hypothetical protein
MAKIRLEFESLKINLRKRRWKLYFVVCTEHPEDSDKMIVGIIPQTGLIRLKPQMNNEIFFIPDGGDDGMVVLEREIPEDRHIKVHTYLRHTRQSTRDFGAILLDIKTELGSNAFEVAENLLGASSPWLIVAKAAIPLLGAILQKIPDKDFGIINMDYTFATNFESQTEEDLHNRFSTGQAELVWSWCIS